MPEPHKKPPTRTPTAVVKPWNSTPLPPARSGFMNRRSGGRGQRALEVMSRRPDHIEALLTLALRELGQFEDALKVLARIGALSPGERNAGGRLCPDAVSSRSTDGGVESLRRPFKFPNAAQDTGATV